MSIVISGVNNNDKITASDGTIDLLSGVTYGSEITVPSLKLGNNIQLGNAGIITATTFAGNISGTTGTFGDFVDVGSNIQLGNAGVVTATTFVGNVTGNVNNTGNLLFQIGGSEKVRINSNGQLGIGVNPTHTLEILSGADHQNVVMVRGNDATTEYAGMGVYNGYAVFTGGGVGSTNAGIIFRTAATGNETERVRITSDGLMGVGTNNPQKNLHLYTSGVATLRIETGDSRGQAWDILSTNGAQNNTGTLSFRDESGSAYLEFGANEGSPQFRVRNGGANDLLHIDNSGRVTKPYNPSFMAYGNSSYTTVPVGSPLNPYIFPNTAHNIGSHYNTSNGKFTCPVDGVYHFDINMFADSTTNQTSAATIEFYVRKNGSHISRLHTKKGYGNMGDDQGTVSISFTEQFSANDEITVFAASYNVSYRIYGGHSYFSGYLVG